MRHREPVPYAGGRVWIAIALSESYGDAVKAPSLCFGDRPSNPYAALAGAAASAFSNTITACFISSSVPIEIRQCVFS